MDDTACQRFFEEPTQTFHRQYEALRAFFIDHCSLGDIAQRFGYSSRISMEGNQPSNHT
jgi:hypothetical protein